MLKNIMVAVLVMIAAAPVHVLSQQAQPAQVPTKIDVAPLNVQNRIGSDVSLKVQLLDAYGHPVSAFKSFDAEVQVEKPSGQSATYSLTFAPGESSKQITVPIGEIGLAKLTVKQHEKQLVGGSNFVLVRPAKSQANAPQQANKPPAAKPGGGPSSRQRDFFHWPPGQARLILAAYPPPQVPAPSQPSSPAQLVLTVSGEDSNGGTRADGTTCARVQVFYLGADDLQRDIQIWLSPSNGMLDNNLIAIRKGTTSGMACWTSQYPIPSATLTVAATNPPNYAFVSGTDGADPRRVTHKFTDNISGIEFVNVPQSLTIVDNFNLTARFKGPSGPVRLSDPRELHFSADSSVLNVNPLKTIVQAGGFDSSTILVPTFFGKSTVQVFTPDYAPVTSVITITWLGVLVASLLGGLLGGILAWINSQGKLWMRVVTGLIVGLVASWAYVIVGLPKLETAFLHNRLSVFFVALLVGLSGVKGLTFISSKFNLPSF